MSLNKQTNKQNKTKKTRAFQESWKVDKNWLRFENESKSMYCDLCIKVQNSNKFTVGCNILKKDSVIPVPQIHSDIDTVSDYLGTVGIEGSQSEQLCYANFARASLILKTSQLLTYTLLQIWQLKMSIPIQHQQKLPKGG
ncbi:hypothetical protein DPMN_157897 [Dreissena polymorpha]|uniref:Uncharacterized protein n=1 Tax=Dreissena polymorpha TaxID=45954 RepID=A0A9D4EGW2_DREPO|nr:hypothetical protein DPMN_157897 [Dreissena polymorpha]